MINLELVFVYDARSDNNWNYFLHKNCPFTTALLFCLCKKKNQLTMCIWSAYKFPIVSHWTNFVFLCLYCTVLMTVAI
jgi:hypothetical protein